MKEMSTNNKVISIIIAVIVVAGLGFYAGMQYGKSTSTPAGFGNRSGQMGQFAGGRTGGQGGARAGGGFINGDVVAKDATSITVQAKDGTGSKFVFFATSTQIMKTSSGSLSDLTIGKTVMVQGTANSDGSVTAQSIQVRPAMPQSPAGN